MAQIELPDLDDLYEKLALSRFVSVEFRRDNTKNNWQKGYLKSIDVNGSKYGSTKGVCAKIEDDDEPFKTIVLPLASDPPYIKFMDVTEYAQERAQKFVDQKELHDEYNRLSMNDEEVPSDLKSKIGLGESKNRAEVQAEEVDDEMSGLIDPTTPFFAVKLRDKEWIQLNPLGRPLHTEPERRKTDVVPDDRKPKRIGEDVHLIIPVGDEIGITPNDVEQFIEEM